MSVKIVRTAKPILAADSIVLFSQEHPWRPKFSSSLVRRFLTELISAEDKIFDLHDDNGRLAVAVLLDKVNNPANDACLEVLGMRPDADIKHIVETFLQFAKKVTPSHRSGFQVTLAEEFANLHGLFNLNGLIPYYDVFKMQNSELDKTAMADRAEIVAARLEEAEEIYDVLCQSFAANPETSIPDLATWKAGFLKKSKSHFYLWKKENKIIGFATLIEDEGGAEIEVGNLGVVAEYRGRGIGRDLLNFCVNKALAMGYNVCHLTVAVDNQKALDLYRRCGFTILEKFSCFRAPLLLK